MPDLRSFLLWGTIRAAVLTPFALALAAFGSDPKAVAKATQNGIELADVGTVLGAIPSWPLVLVVAVGVAYIFPYLGRVEGAGGE